ncbi:MAG TPA: hypothetical protein GX702_14635 [Chloroflexi bacterium]|nr:hypothetical protein [Chloroflexota bacterium]
MPENRDLWAVLLSPEVLVTFIVTALLAGLVIWLLTSLAERRRRGALAQQRLQQEDTIERLLSSLEQDKAKTVAEYEAHVRERDERITHLEGEINRLRDRLSSSGLMGLFGGRQRDVVSALLLENEQLHELVASQQAELREMMSDLTGKLLDRMDRQAQESARAVRYKQALLSAFLQQEEARRLLDQMVAEGRIAPPDVPPEAEESR